MGAKPALVKPIESDIFLIFLASNPCSVIKTMVLFLDGGVVAKKWGGCAFQEFLRTGSYQWLYFWFQFSLICATEWFYTFLLFIFPSFFFDVLKTVLTQACRWGHWEVVQAL